MIHLHPRRPQDRRTPFFLAVVAVLCLAVVAGAAAQEGAPEMSPEEQAMMEAWIEAATPGEPHVRLAENVGDYTITVKAWTDPAGEPEVTEGTASYEMIMDGRYLQETVVGSMMGQTFRGFGLTGYDNVRQRYWSTWVDNMSTGTMVAHGDYDPEAGGLVMHSEYPDPVTGEMKKVRTLTRRQDDGRIVFEWFEPGEGGGEVKTMEIVYVPAG